MELKIIQCPVCGSNELIRITPDGAAMYKCNCCNGKFQDTSVLREYEKLCATISTTVEEQVSEAILREKRDAYYNLRNMLWKNVNSYHIQDSEIRNIVRSILTIAPDDPLAQFFDYVYNASDRNIAKYLKALDVRKNEMNMEIIFEFLIKSLKHDYINATSLLLEKCHEKILSGEKWQTYKTGLETEVSKIEDGVYDLNITRDVFLAYSSKDIDTVSELMEQIEKDGLTCFASFRNLQRGQGASRSYEDDLKKAIDNCKIFLFVSSVNSRSTGCDAYEKEIAYVKGKEQKLHPEYRTYEQIPDKYKMLRIEYRLDDTPSRLVDRELKSFFNGLTRAENYDQLIDKLIECRDQLKVDVDDERGLSKEERKRFEKEKARLAAEREKLEAERHLLNTQKALEKEQIKAQKRKEKRTLAAERRDDFKDKMHDAFSSSTKGIGTALEYSAKAIWIASKYSVNVLWIALKAIFSFFTTSWAWFIITPLLLSLGAIITRAAVGNFILPDTFMLVIYSLCAAWTLGGTIVTLCKKRNIAAYIIGHVIFSAFASMILFGGIIAPKWDFIPTTASVIIAVLVLFLLYDFEFLYDSNRTTIIFNTKCLTSFIVALDVITVAILSIQRPFTINHPISIPFLLSLCTLILFAANLFIKTKWFENIITSACLTLIFPFIMYGGLLSISIQILFSVLFAITAVFATYHIMATIKQKFDCDSWSVLVIIFGVIIVFLSYWIFDGFMFPSIEPIIIYAIAIIAMWFLQALTFENLGVLPIILVSLAIISTIFLLFYGGILPGSWDKIMITIPVVTVSALFGVFKYYGL